MNYESGLTQKFSVNKMILGLSSPISFLSNVKPGCFFSNFHAPKSGFVIQRVGQRDGNSFFLQPQLGSQDGGGFVQQSVGLGPGTLVPIGIPENERDCFSKGYPESSNPKPLKPKPPTQTIGEKLLEK